MKLAAGVLIQFSVQPQIQAYIDCMYRKARSQEADFGSHSSSGFIKMLFIEGRISKDNAEEVKSLINYKEERGENMRLRKSYKGNLIVMSAKPVRDRQLIERGLQPDWSIA